MEDIERFLHEDLNEKGDITSDALLEDEEGKARIIAKENCILAGLEEAGNVFSKLGLAVSFTKDDGSEARAGDIVMEIKGKARSILSGERLALNIISRMSGIATLTNELVKICRKKIRR